MLWKQQQMYDITHITEPYTLDHEQDMWVGEISFTAETNEDPDHHENCIEVRAESETLLHRRLETIVHALNEGLL